ncbi:oxidoreductase (plasmid) [Candidatus Megaera polyxenophila]|nr:oxidoreductase [Candidatus Megaera polyxenophila]
MKVGLIGCGRIAFEAHLPAYKKYNIKVVAVCDLVEERAKKAAEEFNVPFYCTDLQELAARQDVELIDIATTPLGRIDLLRSLYSHGKPLLIQKPLSYDLSEATLICNELKLHGIKAAVNHNARWAPVSIRIKEIIESKKLGELYQVHHINRYNENLKSWYTDIDNYMFLDHGLHYFDLIRLFVKKNPVEVSALHRKIPGQKANCPLTYSVNLKYDDSFLSSLYFNNAVPAPNAFDCQWFIDGTHASVKATIDSISLQNASGYNTPMTRLEGDWIPEGFYGSYKSFVDSIINNYIPLHSPEDHLESFKVAYAVAESANHQGKWIEVK